ncbi:MAG: TetR/AcrR family transcriptional regulator, partial [Phaeodactylibacter sp.]|nr:TetR/AcrR family transcriptional regulator [Phaeodactylibacter sp.]
VGMFSLKMKSNRDKILESALMLFNRDGFVNVRLQHIADEAVVSVGNLAYHFPNKDAILLTIYEELARRQKELLAEYKVVPLFDNIDRLIRRTFRLQQDYIFFYLDTLELIRANTAIAEAHRQHISWQVAQLKAMYDFNAARGAMVAEPREGLFEQLALHFWTASDFWFTRELARGNPEFEEQAYRSALWALLLPYFTEMGMREYGQMLQSPYDFFF